MFRPLFHSLFIYGGGSQILKRQLWLAGRLQKPLVVINLQRQLLGMNAAVAILGMK
jgi:predicted branched-subunit amino acid permease